MNILREIAEHKKREISELKREFRKLSPDLRPRDPLPFPPGNPFVIAEIKAASPSAGRILPEGFDHLAIAQTYKTNGADAISIVVDRHYFQGDPCWIREIAALEIPILFKEFVVDPWQIDFAYSLGADIVLLIASILPPHQIEEFAEKITAYHMTPLIEIHSVEEIGKVKDTNRAMIGINNRDLTTFRVDIENTLKILPHLPEGSTVVSESGIETIAQIVKLRNAGVNGFLIGTSILKSENLGKKLRELKNAALG